MKIFSKANIISITLLLITISICINTVSATGRHNSHNNGNNDHDDNDNDDNININCGCFANSCFIRRIDCSEDNDDNDNENEHQGGGHKGGGHHHPNRPRKTEHEQPMSSPPPQEHRYGHNSRNKNHNNHHIPPRNETNTTCRPKCSVIEPTCIYGCSKNYRNNMCQCFILSDDFDLILIDPETGDIIINAGRWPGAPVPSPHTQPPQPTPLSLPSPPITEESPVSTPEPTLPPIVEEPPVSIPEPVSIPTSPPPPPVIDDQPIPSGIPPLPLEPVPITNTKIFDLVELNCENDVYLHSLDFKIKNANDDFVNVSCNIDRNFNIEKSVFFLDATVNTNIRPERFASFNYDGSILFIQPPPKTYCLSQNMNASTMDIPGTKVSFTVRSTAKCYIHPEAITACDGDTICLSYDNSYTSISIPVAWNPDKTSPLISGVVNGEYSINYSQFVDRETSPHYKTEGIYAVDRCSGNVPVERTFEYKNRDNICPEYSFDIEYTWKAKDTCDNTAQVISLYHVRDDVKPQIMDAPTELSMDLKCEDFTSGLTQLPPIPENITAIDDSDENAIIEFNEIVIPSEKCLSESTIQRKWTARDACGNTDTIIQTFNIKDKHAPELKTELDICIWPPVTNKIISLNNVAEVLSRLISKELCGNELYYALIPNGYCISENGNDTDLLKQKPPCFIDGEVIYALSDKAPVKTRKGVEIPTKRSPRIFTIGYILKDQCGNEREMKFHLIVPHESSEEAINKCSAVLNGDHITLTPLDIYPTTKSSLAVVPNKDIKDFLEMPMPIDKIEKYANAYELSPGNARLNTKPLWENDPRIRSTMTRQQISIYINKLNRDSNGSSGSSKIEISILCVIVAFLSLLIVL